MMRVLLATLNAKYIHSSLALACLSANCQSNEWELITKEYTINEDTDMIMADIFMNRPDVLALSCYIWNIEQIKMLGQNFKKISPHTYLILGGPEVSYDAQEFLKQNKWADLIICGEGEHIFKNVLSNLKHGLSLDNITGIAFKKVGQGIVNNPGYNIVEDISEINSPYDNVKQFPGDKIVYYETSRGCPFNCSYCLSSTIKGVRYSPIERVKNDLTNIISSNVKEIKFVDRTSNCDEDRFLEIVKFVLAQPGNTRFHFEIEAGLLTNKILDYLQNVPPGRLDFEIGIQSTYEPTLRAINRYQYWDKIKEKIKQLVSYGNIHVHLDLIAGLPLETYSRFALSFNDVYGLKADVIQLGFLKLLKGSHLWQIADTYGYKYQNNAPYKVLENNYISYEELCHLEEIEHLVDRYYNTHQADNTLTYVIDMLYKGNAFLFFEQFALYWHNNNFFRVGHRREAEYEHLINFISDMFGGEVYLINELIKFDFLINNMTSNLPKRIERYNPGNINDFLYECLKDRKFVESNIPELSHLSARELRRRVHLEQFIINPLTRQKNDLKVLFIYDSSVRKAYKYLFL